MMKREVIIMGVVQATQKDIELLARLMRAEAESDGNMGMLLVGNVGVNRVLANCHDFKNIKGGKFNGYHDKFKKPNHWKKYSHRFPRR